MWDSSGTDLGQQPDRTVPQVYAIGPFGRKHMYMSQHDRMFRTHHSVRRWTRAVAFRRVLLG
ncbi:hypothetical protein DIE14_20925 [Burkholderia sp. Bp9017]|nr:hypothetical protein DIE14_20925 [Burkholderia sp. Bp9017]RQZ32326.1 hypothetical protein DIE13_20805 [Burkholderia sp. Bp9016]